MAKNKKGAKRSKRMGRSSMMNPSSPVLKIAAVAAGYFLGEKIIAPLEKLIPLKNTPASGTTPATVAPIIPEKVIHGAEAGLGALLLMKGKSTMVKTIAGGLLAGRGLKGLMTDFNIMTGFQSVPVLGKAVRGYQITPVLGAVPASLQGTTNNGYRVNGLPPQLSGYVPNGSGVGVMGSLYTNGSGINVSDR